MNIKHKSSKTESGIAEHNSRPAGAEQYVALTFWLPAGKTLFWREKEDSALRNSQTTGLTFESSSVSQYPSTFSSCHDRFKKQCDVVESFTKNKTGPTSASLNDPTIAYWQMTTRKQKNKLLVRVDAEGFYLFIFLGTIDVNNCLDQVLDLCGTFNDHTKIKTYHDDSGGLLSYTQLNLIFEGVYNYNFEPDVFFTPTDEKHQDIQTSYSLENFVRGVSTTTTVNDLGPSFAKCLSAFSQGERPEWANFEEIYARPQITGESSDSTEDKVNPEVSSPNFVRVSIRKFAHFTAKHYLQRLRFNLENCRRRLLKDNLSVLHRIKEIEQIINPDEDSQQIDNASEDQLYGYVLLVSSKYPLLLTMKRYLAEIEDLYSKHQDFFGTTSYIHGWIRIVDSIHDSIHGIESASEMIRLERMLFELEQLRSEQEAATELFRGHEHVEWPSGDDSDSTRIAKGSYIVAFLGLLITLLIYPDQIYSAVRMFTWDNVPGSAFKRYPLPNIGMLGNSVVVWAFVVSLVLSYFIYIALYFWDQIRMHAREVLRRCMFRRPEIHTTTKLILGLAGLSLCLFVLALTCPVWRRGIAFVAVIMFLVAIVLFIFRARNSWRQAISAYQVRIRLWKNTPDIPSRLQMEIDAQLLIHIPVEIVDRIAKGRLGHCTSTTTDDRGRELNLIIRSTMPSAYRVERVNSGESLHKLHIGVQGLIYSQGFDPFVRPVSELKGQFIYAISTAIRDGDDFERKMFLREVRFIGAFRSGLAMKERQWVKQCLIDHYINFQWTDADSDETVGALLDKIRLNDSVFLLPSGKTDDI